MPTRPALLRCCGLVCAVLLGAAHAEPAPLAVAAPDPAVPEPAVQRTVIDGADSRIDELRVRGETRRITVTPKHGGKPYEIVPPSAARDPSAAGSRGATGQRVWNLLDF